MKRKFTPLVFVFAMLSISANAQVVLNSSYIPVIGDNHVNKVILDTTISPGLAGANITWDYSNFYIYPQTINQNYVAPSTTAFASSFPTANLAVNSNFFASNGYEFYIRSANSLQYLGYKDPNNEFLITNTQNLLTVPLQYGDSVTNQPVTGTGLFGSVLTGTISTKADGWGNLDLSDGSYQNVLRVKYDFNLQTSFGPGTETYYRILKYAWYVAGQIAPVLEISILDVSGASTSHQKVVTRLAYVTGIENEIAPELSFEFINNPASGMASIKVNNNKSIEEVKIYDLNGKLVSLVKADFVGNGLYTFDISALTSGIYMVSSDSFSTTFRKKLVVKNTD